MIGRPNIFDKVGFTKRNKKEIIDGEWINIPSSFQF
jgi:hypothetical protein